jgi:hypothetical protein
MVARYERRPLRNDDCADDQAGSCDSVAVHRPGPPKKATFLAGSRSMTSGTWARAEKSSSHLAASRLIMINRPSRGFMR